MVAPCNSFCAVRGQGHFIFNCYSYAALMLLVCCFQFPCISSSSSAANSNSTELAYNVCKNTTDYNFCMGALYSDPRTATADRYVLAYISFDLAYLNATNTRAYIDKAFLDNINSTIKSGLKRCQGYYGKGVRVLAEAINDLDSETFFELSRLAIASDRAARDCQSTFHGHPPLDLSPMNHNLRILSNICYVVSKLFNVSY
ncbi:hypothetical protein LguiB_031623 [Lonicera macranthoides]